MYYIYALIDPRTDLPFYIGKGLKRNSRHLDHFKENSAAVLNRHKFYKMKFLQAQGYNVPVKILLDDIVNELEAYDKETDYIKFYGRKNIDPGGILTNICLGNKPPNHKGRKQSLEHKRKRIESYKNTVKEYGKKMPESFKRNLSERMKGNKNHFYGKTHTAEFKAAHSARMKGNKNNGKVYKFTDPENNDYFVEGSFCSFCREHGLPISTMEKILHNKTISKGKCKGWQVVKVNTDEVDEPTDNIEEQDQE